MVIGHWFWPDSLLNRFLLLVCSLICALVFFVPWIDRAK